MPGVPWGLVCETWDPPGKGVRESSLKDPGCSILVGCGKPTSLMGTGFSPYIKDENEPALATEGCSSRREDAPHGLLALDIASSMYGLKSLPENQLTAT